MKLTKLQQGDLAHCGYVRLTTEPEEREPYETDQFLENLIAKIESGKMIGLSQDELAWLADEADNLESISASNFRCDSSEFGSLSSALNLSKKIKEAQ